MAFTTGGKFAIVGGAVGLTGGVVYALTRRNRRRGSGGEEGGVPLLPDDSLPFLETHDLYRACFTLARFRHVAVAEFREACTQLNRVLELAAKASGAVEEANPSEVEIHAWPGMVRSSAHRAANALHRMQLKVCAAKMDEPEFGEALEEVRAALESQQHNVAMDVSVRVAS